MKIKGNRFFYKPKALSIGLISLTLFIGVNSCQQAPKNKLPVQSEPVRTLQIKHAKWFKVSYFDTYKTITLIDPWSSKAYWTYYISISSSCKLSPDSLPERASLIHHVGQAAVLSATQIGIFEKLSLLDTIVAVGNGQFIHNSTIKLKLRYQKVIELGEDASINIEKTIRLKPSLIFTTGWDKIESHFEPIVRQNIPVVFCFDWQEQTPLARAEWIKFVAAFYNKEQEAIAQFDSIEMRYQQLARACDTIARKPTVFHAMPISGTWYVAGGQSYMAAFYRDAGATYIWANDVSKASLSMSFEAVFQKAQHAEIWFAPTEFNTKDRFLGIENRFQLFDAFKNSKLYSNSIIEDQQFTNPFWEEGILQPDVVLRDLIQIIHPNLLPATPLVYYQNLR